MLKRQSVGVIFGITLCVYMGWTPASVAQTKDVFTATNLSDLYQLALVNDAIFQATKEKHLANNLDPKVSRSKLLPKLELKINRSRITDQKTRGLAFGNIEPRCDPCTYSIDSHSLSLTQPLFQREYYIELAQSKSVAQRSQLELQSAQQDLIIRLSEAYFGVLTAQTHLDFKKAEKSAVQKQFDQSQQRLQVGQGNITDAKKAEAARDLVTAELIAAENTLQVRKLALQLIVKQPIGRLALLNEQTQIVAPEPANIDTWVQTALDKNLDLLRKKLDSNIAADEVKRQRSGHFPTIDLYAQRNEMDLRGGLTPRTIRNNEFGMQINIPLFSGGETYYKSKQATHRYNSAIQLLEQTHREVDQNMRTAYFNVITDINRIAALDKAVESANISYESNQIGFRAGRNTSVDVLLAVEELFEAKRNHSETRHNYILNTLRIKQIAGQLSELDVTRINQWLN